MFEFVRRQWEHAESSHLLRNKCFAHFKQSGHGRPWIAFDLTCVERAGNFGQFLFSVRCAGGHGSRITAVEECKTFLSVVDTENFASVLAETSVGVCFYACF
uniref:Uncharacterized protein n=1 Tax=Cacopsylla melanoneura TaxID=428564 RepID=A0A8D8RSE5_9HEMI